MYYKFAYMGEGFHGCIRQPKKKTVEGDIREALANEGFCENIRIACRTDKGVSALCNMFYSGEKEDFSSRITSKLHDIWIYAHTRGELDMKACLKHYIYFYTGKRAGMEKAARHFCGTHDFSYFSRLEKRNPLRTLDIRMEERGEMLLLHFLSSGFLWEMVRRIVGAMELHCSGRLSRGDIEEMFQKKIRKDIPPAPPQNLLLADIETNAKFITDDYVVSKMKKEFLSRQDYHRIMDSMYGEMRTLLQR